MLKIPQSFIKANASLSKTVALAKGKPYTPVRADANPLDTLRTKSVDNVSRGLQSFEAEKEMGEMQKLDYERWLPACAQVYQISPRIEDYIIVNTIICPSDIPNRNGIGFPAKELATWQPPPIARIAYEAWKGCPVHLEHDNEDHTKAYGVILDATLSRVTGYGGGKLWKVNGLLAIDKNKYPDIAMEVLKRIINTYSMGALVDMFRCSYCGTECWHDSKRDVPHCCTHISSTKEINWNEVRDYNGKSHVAFLNAYGISPIECSIVRDPAWAPALSDDVFDPWGQASPNSKIVTRDQGLITPR